MFREQFAQLVKQSDQDLLRSLTSILARDNQHKAESLVYFAAVDARKLYASLGYSSFFAFLTQKFGMSESLSFKTHPSEPTRTPVPVSLR